MKPGDLVQIKRGILGQGDVGVAVGWGTLHYAGGTTVKVLEVLFSDGIRQVHPGNLQKPDGRTRLRRQACNP